MFHSDRGIEYAATGFSISRLGMLQSMNRAGKMNDNAHMESFFHSMKCEELFGKTFDNEGELRAALGSYVAFYNRERLHSLLRHLPPAAFALPHLSQRDVNQNGASSRTGASVRFAPCKPVHRPSRTSDVTCKSQLQCHGLTLIKTVLKVLLLGALAYALYKGAWIYSGVKWVTYVTECAEQVQMCDLGRRKAPDDEVAAAATELYACVQERQPAIESVFLRVPKSHAEISSDPLDHRYAAEFCLSP